MHQALYRKWRPKTFDEVSGQEHITSVLKYEVETGKTSHAYLFCGSRGTGKTSCAKLLAKAVNCLSPVGGNPCGHCEACRRIDAGSATDVLEMDAASNNGVDYIRDIRDEVVYSPADLKYRVYIVDEVHMLSSGAFNALLKTLEEPPAHVIFILATTELHKLPATIISRCQRFDFRRIATSIIAERLLYIAKEEGIALSPDAASLIGKLSLGGMRDAISMLELCAGTPGEITPEAVANSVGVSSRDKVVGLVSAVAERDMGRAFETVADITQSSVDVSVFWQSFAEYLRDLLVLKSTPKGEEYLELLPQEAEECKRLAGAFTKERLVSLLSLVDGGAAAMARSSASKRLTAELYLVKMCDSSLDDSNAALAARVAELEEKIYLLSSGAVTAAPAAKPAPEPKTEKSAPKAEAPKAEAPETSEKKTEKPAETVRKNIGNWPETVERISAKNKAIGTFLSGGSAFVSGDTYIIRIGNRFFADMLSKADNTALIAEGLSLTCGKNIPPQNVKIELVSDGAKPDGGNDIISGL